MGLSVLRATICVARMVVLPGHPKLKNDLRRSSMENILGSRATIFELKGFGSEKRKYLEVVAGTIGFAEDQN